MEGLWKKDDQYYAVCPDLDTVRTQDGKPLEEWFNHHCRVGTSPVSLVASVPALAEHVPARTPEQLALSYGEPLNSVDFFTILHLALPLEFPNFIISSSDDPIVFTFANALSSSNAEMLKLAYESVGCPARYAVKIDPAVTTTLSSFSAEPAGGISLLPSRRLPASVARSVRNVLEQDEDFWASNRTKLMTTTKWSSSADVLPESFRPNGSAALIDASVFAPENLRNYLCLYDTVYIVAPLRDYLEQQCTSFGITPTEFIELMSTGRIRLLFPQSVNRYDLKWLSAVAERAPDNILLSRRLASATTLDMRRRWPLFALPLRVEDQHAVLAALTKAAAEAENGPYRLWLSALCSSLGRIWVGQASSLNIRGAMTIIGGGLSQLVAEFIRLGTGRDLVIELSAAGAGVQWASALGASLFPYVGENYSEQNAAETLASLMGARVGKNVPTVAPEVHTVLDGILSVANDVPVVDFAKEFGSGDISRLRALVVKMAQWNQHPDFLSDAIARFNQEVRQVEKRLEFLRKLKIEALAPAVARVMLPTSNPTLLAIKTFAPLGVWMANAAMLMVGDSLISKSPTLSRVSDFTSGVLAGQSADAVLISRVKKQMKILKS